MSRQYFVLHLYYFLHIGVSSFSVKSMTNLVCMPVSNYQAVTLMCVHSLKRTPFYHATPFILDTTLSLHRVSFGSQVRSKHFEDQLEWGFLVCLLQLLQSDLNYFVNRKLLQQCIALHIR